MQTIATSWIDAPQVEYLRFKFEYFFLGRGLPRPFHEETPSAHPTSSAPQSSLDLGPSRLLILHPPLLSYVVVRTAVSVRSVPCRSVHIRFHYTVNKIISMNKINGVGGGGNSPLCLRSSRLCLQYVIMEKIIITMSDAACLGISRHRTLFTTWVCL